MVAEGPDISILLSNFRGSVGASSKPGSGELSSRQTEEMEWFLSASLQVETLSEVYKYRKSAFRCESTHGQGKCPQ